MRKMAAVVLVLVILGSIAPAAAQKTAPPKQSAGARLEALLNSADIPFNKPEEGRYNAVISVSQDESERFNIALSHLGDDPNQEKLQFYQMYFLLGQMPKGASFPNALIKQINEWNTNLTMGKVVAVEGYIMYISSAWFSQTSADSLTQDAVMGHYVSQDLRKSVAPYLKQ
ncbi:MAG: hypothetical protein LAP21_03615 [Acidobacteriia bacterium]|nr:hypothetical protein [Terriglobia bacterium]